MVNFLTWFRSLGKLIHNIFDSVVHGLLVTWQCCVWVTHAVGYVLEVCGNVSVKVGKAIQSV